jgi:hypothetical protein
MATGQNSGNLSGSENVGGISFDVTADISPLKSNLEEAKAVAVKAAEDLENTLHLNASFDANAIKDSLEKEIAAASKNAELNLNLDDHLFKGFDDLPGKVEPVARSIGQKFGAAYESVSGIGRKIAGAIAPLSIFAAGAGVAVAAFIKLKDAMEAAQKRADYFRTSKLVFDEIVASLNKLGDVGSGSVPELRAEIKRFGEEAQKQEDDVFKKRREGLLTAEQLNARIDQIRETRERKVAELVLAIDDAINAKIRDRRKQSDDEYANSQKQLAERIAEFTRKTTEAELEGIDKVRAERDRAIGEAEALRAETADRAQRDELDKAIKSIKQQYEAKVEAILDEEREARTARSRTEREAKESAERQAAALQRAISSAFDSIRQQQTNGLDRLTVTVERIAQIINRIESSRR